MPSAGPRGSGECDLTLDEILAVHPWPVVCILHRIPLVFLLPFPPRPVPPFLGQNLVGPCSFRLVQRLETLLHLLVKFIEYLVPLLYYRVHKACSHQDGLYLYYLSPLLMLLNWSLVRFPDSVEIAAACFDPESRLNGLFVPAGRATQFLALAGCDILVCYESHNLL